MPQTAPTHTRAHSPALPSEALRELSPALPALCLQLNVSRGQPRPRPVRHCTGHRKWAWAPPTNSPSEARTHSWGLAGVNLKNKLVTYFITGKRSLFGKSRELPSGTKQSYGEPEASPKRQKQGQLLLGSRRKLRRVVLNKSSLAENKSWRLWWVLIGCDRWLPHCCWRRERSSFLKSRWNSYTKNVLPY